MPRGATRSSTTPKSAGTPSWLVARTSNGARGRTALDGFDVRFWHPYFWLCVARGLMRSLRGSPFRRT